VLRVPSALAKEMHPGVIVPDGEPPSVSGFIGVFIIRNPLQEPARAKCIRRDDVMSSRTSIVSPAIPSPSQCVAGFQQTAIV
jgi:hypothetical protein